MEGKGSQRTEKREGREIQKVGMLFTGILVEVYVVVFDGPFYS